MVLDSARRDGEPRRLRPDSLAAATAEHNGRVPYGESSRKYRRTVYDVDDWKRHRSGDRMVDNLKSILVSGVVRQLWKEVALVSSMAAAVVLWNHYLAPELDISPATLPPLPFTLSSSSMGLLLVFRTNASYGRWWEARKTWGTIITQSRNLVRKAAAAVDDPNQLDDLRISVWLVARSLMNRLSGEDDEQYFRSNLRQMVPGDELRTQMIQTDDRIMAALMEASSAVACLPVSERQRVEMDKSLVIIGDCMGACERIFTSPVPLVYTRHTARFLSLWMLLLPFGLADQLPGWTLVPAMAMLSFFLFGIEELAVQLEEPFSILPMQRFCDGIGASGQHLQDWSAGAKERHRRED